MGRTSSVSSLIVVCSGGCEIFAINFDKLGLVTFEFVHQHPVLVD